MYLRGPNSRMAKFGIENTLGARLHLVKTSDKSNPKNSKISAKQDKLGNECSC